MACTSLVLRQQPRLTKRTSKPCSNPLIEWKSTLQARKMDRIGLAKKYRKSTFVCKLDSRPLSSKNSPRHQASEADENLLVILPLFVSTQSTFSTSSATFARSVLDIPTSTAGSGTCTGTSPRLGKRPSLSTSSGTTQEAIPRSTP